ncbi:hypothetical protein ACFSUK_04295 [Sphingobium scionense]
MVTILTASGPVDGETLHLLPQWTEKADKRGLDPLGMQNSGVLLYQSLLPGISNVTLRMRYYGFYCWLSETYARSAASSDFEAWRNWIRRAEALYALVSARAGEGGVGGVEWANRRLAAAEPVIDFAAAASTDPSQERYLRQSLGVFGGAYYTQMAEMGLFTENRHGIQVVTRDLGRRAADLFAQAVGTDCTKLLARKIAEARISIHELERLEPIVPSHISPDSDECRFYETLLFAREASPAQSAKSRAATLGLILETARATGGRPGPEDVRWHLFDPPRSLARAPRGPTPQLGGLSMPGSDAGGVGCPAGLGHRDHQRRWAWANAFRYPPGGRRPPLRSWRSVLPGKLAQPSAEPGPAKLPYRAIWEELTNSRAAPVGRTVPAIMLMAALHQRLRARPDLAGAATRGLPGAERHGRCAANWTGSKAMSPTQSLI